MTAVAATVGDRTITVADVDARERAIRAGDRRHALPRPGTSEARQLRRWLTHLMIAESVVAAVTVDATTAPAECELLPDEVARLELGSIAAATLCDPRARAVFAAVTAQAAVPDDAVADYHARNPHRFAVATAAVGGWNRPAVPPTLEDARGLIRAHLLAVERRRMYRRWLDARCAALAVPAAGYEHPGDPRQPDNTHRH